MAASKQGMPAENAFAKAEGGMDPAMTEDAWSWHDGRECTVSTVAELRAALAHAARDRTTTIRLEAGAYELDAVLEVERGARVCLEGPEELAPAPETADHRLGPGAVVRGFTDPQPGHVELAAGLALRASGHTLSVLFGPSSRIAVSNAATA